MPVTARGFVLPLGLEHETLPTSKIVLQLIEPLVQTFYLTVIRIPVDCFSADVDGDSPGFAELIE